MLTYWAMFATPIVLGAAPYRLDAVSRRLGLGCLLLALVLIIGLRWKTGMDWGNYQRIFDRVADGDLRDAVIRPEFSYYLINYVVGRLGGDLTQVNLICAVFFAGGFIAFAKEQPNPWRFTALAAPVLLIGVAMSANRQAVALGMLMAAFVAFQQRRFWAYVALVSFGGLFHISVLAFLGFAWFLRRRYNAVTLAGATVIVIAAGLLLSGSQASYYRESYVEGGGIEAVGALPRVMLNVVAASAFFVVRKQWRRMYDDSLLFTLMAVTAVAFAMILPVSQVGADRMSMYLIPFQLAVFARLPVFLRSPQLRGLGTLAVYGLYAAILFTWLNFSWQAKLAWVPYESAIGRSL